MYGPVDMVTLSGERVDVYVMDSDEKYNLFGVETTDNHGRVTFEIPAEKRLQQVIYSYR